MGKKILFTDAVIHTGRTETETAASMLVENGRIVSLDPEDARGARTVSLGGKHVYPCLIDGHIHLLSTIVLAAQGFEVCRIENGGIAPDTLGGVEKRLRGFAASKPKNSVVVGNNYIITAIREHRLPNRQELDEWCGGRAVAVYTIDGHASALSTAMLRKIGIEPEGHDGVLTGEAHDRVQGRLTDAIAASVTLSVLARGIANFQNKCAEYGISCVGALDGNGDSEKDFTTKLLVFLAKHFDIDVRLYYQYWNIDKALPLTKSQNRRRIGGCGDWEMDGASGAHSAAFSLPYRDTGTTAECYYTQEDVDRTVARADAEGFQIACHAIGDKAVDRIVKALRGTSGKVRHRIEHCEFASDAAIEEIASRGYAVMAQPGYSWIDKRFLHTYERYLPDELIARLKFRTLLEKGICLCGSSDSPVQDIDPWQQMLGMTEFYREEESVSAYQAFRCYTANAAEALLEGDNRGMLLPGMRADFFTGDRDLFALTPNEICAFRPCGTYYSGRPAKRRNGTAAGLFAMILKNHKKV